MSEEKNWIWQMRHALKTPKQISERFSFTKEELFEIEEVLQNTRASITPYLCNLIQVDKYNRIVPNDPIWLQYGPSKKEGKLIETTTSWEVQNEMFADGLTDDLRKETNPEVREYLGQHKYPDKVVIRVAHHCASYCRFCYVRSRTLNSGSMANMQIAKQQAVDYITKYNIREVILTGGDPLALANNILESWIQLFSNITNVESVRIHTRLPAQNPYRVDSDLLNMLESYPKVKWINIQINHPIELTEEFIDIIHALKKIGITVKTENPIIKDVNDDPEILTKFISTCRSIGLQHHHWFHSMQVTPVNMRISVEKMVLLFQQVKEKLGGIRWNASELGDLVIAHPDGKRTIPFEEINIDITKEREHWGTNKFMFTRNNNNEPIIKFTSWRSSETFQEYIDPNINTRVHTKSDFYNLI